MVGVALVYAGFGVALVGLASIARPLVFLGVRTRWAGLAALGGGALLAVIGAALPVPTTFIGAARTRLDEFADTYQFSERHSRRIAAPPGRVYAAIREVTAGEIACFRALTWIRRLGTAGPESILNPPEGQPILEVATRSGFLLLADEPARELVIGTLVIAPRGAQRPAKFLPEDFKRLDRAGFAKGVMNFRIESVAGGASLLTTETRVFATDPWTRRRFAAYWRVIYPGSALIRRMWLRAIDRRATSPGAGSDNAAGAGGPR